MTSCVGADTAKYFVMFLFLGGEPFGGNGCLAMSINCIVL